MNFYKIDGGIVFLNRNPDFATENDLSMDPNDSRMNLNTTKQDKKNSDEDSDGEINFKNIIR